MAQNWETLCEEVTEDKVNPSGISSCSISQKYSQPFMEFDSSTLGF
jgi:hypothetical protein